MSSTLAQVYIKSCDRDVRGSYDIPTQTEDCLTAEMEPLKINTLRWTWCEDNTLDRRTLMWALYQLTN